jgi:putative transposase
MPRRPRVATGGYAYHVLNRAVGRCKIFRKNDDYLAFERVLEEVHERLPTRILSYCLMPNHWHLVLWPAADGELSQFLRLLTVTHTQRWHAHYHSAGSGPLYQGRFKSFPIQQDEHLLKACRYVERNALAAGLAPRAEAWPWGSACKRKRRPAWLLAGADWPLRRPGHWRQLLDTPLNPREAKQIETSVERGRPLGDDNWVQQTARRLSLESTLRDRGGQPKHENGNEE